jgi:prevent-host-death family protein
MIEVGTLEARTHLSALLDEVARGGTILITRYGKPVARLVPFESPNRDNRREAIAQLKKLRKGRTLSGLSLRALIDEGRR